MANNPSTENYTLGKGICYFNKLNQSTGLYEGERDLGNAPAVTSNIELTKLDHYSARGGLKAKDKSVISEITPMIKFTLDEMSSDNLSLMYLGTLSTVTQVANTNKSAVLTAVTPDMFYSLGERHVGITKLDYAGGTTIFTVGEVVSGATGVGTVVQVIGDATSGTLYLKNVTPGFVDGESLTGDGSGAANANGTETFLNTAVSVEDADTPGTFFVAGTDFTVSSGSGRIKILDTGTITQDANLNVVFSIEAATFGKLTGLSETVIEGSFRFISDNPLGEQRELEVHRLSLTPTGDVAYIGDAWSTIEFEGEILKDEVNHPDSPYLNIYMD